ncbi:MAG: AAA family ATPase [Limisphaerales bacterium]
MITLTKAQVFKYKSIEDSSPVTIMDDVTVLVGKNESGKTAFLEALHKALPLSGAKFNPVFDYPKHGYTRYMPQHKTGDYAKVVSLTFRIENDLVKQINKELFHEDQIIPEGHTFTRTTHYGNGSSIELSVDQVKVLQTLKKHLEGLENVEEVFANATGLQKVIENIEEKQLPTDSKLAAFAKEWTASFEKAPTGWNIVTWRIWNSYIKASLPKFLYFDDYKLLDGKISLESLSQRKANNTLTDADETALGLFELASTDIDELMSEEGYENSKAKLEAIGLTITQQIFEYWKQNKELSVEFDIKADPTDAPPFNSGKNLYIRIKNHRHGVTVPFDLRSKGFIWFFSFMVWFSSVENRANTNDDLILLLDEPGINLHALAQENFLNYIETLSKQHQIIYTTHSPFMIDSGRLETVRVVEDHLKEGTKITEELEGSSEDSLFPLQAALGYSIAQNLFISKRNLLVEGPADLILLQHMSLLMEEEGKTGLADSVLVPVGGLDKLATFVALLGANKLKIAVLHDRASTPHQKLDDLVRHKLIEKKRVLNFSMFRTPEDQETDIEDLFPDELYLKAFNTAYKKELNGVVLSKKDLGQHPRIIERINQFLKTNNIALLKDGGFNHYRVAQELLPMLTHKNLSEINLESFETLFTCVNKALS